MTRSFIPSCLLLLISAGAFAQHNITFELELPQQKTNNSLYNSITLLDTRSDTTNLGIVPTGTFNRKAVVLPAKPLQQQLNEVLQACNAPGAGNGQLLLHLRRLSFAEVMIAPNELGYCYLRADLYASNGEGYLKLGGIDTVLTLKKPIDVTKTLLKKGGEAISRFIAGNINKQAVATTWYSYTEIAAKDSTEKSKLKLYTTTEFTNGAYLSYDAFKNQIPDKPDITISRQGNNIRHVKVQGNSDKWEKLKSTEIYAIVYEGKPYIATYAGYYPLKKANGEFNFTGKTGYTADAGHVLTTWALQGTPAEMDADDIEADFDLMIDHLNGKLIRLKEVEGEF